MGLFRQVCSNGLCTSEGSYNTHKFKHFGNADQFVEGSVIEMVETIPSIAGRVKTFQAIELSHDEQKAFAHSAALIKYDPEVLAEKKIEINTNALVMPTRSADVNNSLWHTYNRVQEKIIKGEKFLRKENKYGYQKRSKARGVTSIVEDLRINRALWTLTEQMAKLKTA
jgi:hypothetical protein